MYDSVFKLRYPETVSSLSAAAKQGDLNAIRVLLAKGSLPQSPDNRGWCSIHWSVVEKQTEALRLLLNHRKQSKKYLVNLCSWEGETPLMLALADEDASQEIIEILLKSGADASKARNDGMTALHLACKSRGDLTLIRKLLDGGADLNARELVQGFTPLHLAVANRANVDVVHYLIEESTPEGVVFPDFENETALVKACAFNFTEAARMLLIKAPSAVNSMPNFRLSPLALAAWNGNMEIVRMLIDAGASTRETVRAVFSGRPTPEEIYLPLHSSFGNVEVFKFLLQKTDPAALLMCEPDASLSVLAIMHGSGSKHFEILLQHPFPVEFSDLKILQLSKFRHFLSKNPDFPAEMIVTKFRELFRYCSYLEPEEVFDYFKESEDPKTLGLVRLTGTLGASDGKMAVNSPLKKDEECVRVFSRRVLSLQQICRPVVRRFWRGITGSEWDAYVALRDSSLPWRIKEYLWYQC